MSEIRKLEQNLIIKKIDKETVNISINNNEMLFDNLKACFGKDASYKAKAKKDREFVKFFENADFIALF